MTESSPPPSSSPAQSTTLPLRSLQETLHDRITQKKAEIQIPYKSLYRQSVDRDRNITLGLGSNTNS
jgi:hypothetical protein